MEIFSYEWPMLQTNSVFKSDTFFIHDHSSVNEWQHAYTHASFPSTICKIDLNSDCEVE